MKTIIIGIYIKPDLLSLFLRTSQQGIVIENIENLEINTDNNIKPRSLILSPHLFCSGVCAPP
jgi:hypothetical protein